MQAAGKRFEGKHGIWILLALILLPILISGIWYYRQVRQQRLDRSLIEAIQKNDTPTAISLLNHGADANAVDKPYTPITFKSLLAELCDRVRANKTTKGTKHYPTALIVSESPFYISDNYEDGVVIPKDNPVLIQALLNHGANPTATNKSGDTILHLAVNSNHLQAVKVLLEHHVHPNARGYHGRTPLFDADYDCARLLIENGAKVSIKDEPGRTALDYARIQNDVLPGHTEHTKDLIRLLEETLKLEHSQSKRRQ